MRFKYNYIKAGFPYINLKLQFPYAPVCRTMIFSKSVIRDLSVILPATAENN